MFGQSAGGFQFGQERSVSGPAVTGFSAGGDGENEDSNNAPFGNTKSSMDDVTMSTQSQQEKKKDTRPKQTLFPLTLKMVHNASNEDNEVKVHGLPLVSALVVAQVISVEKKNASFEFRVTDTTATIKAAYYYSQEDEDLVAELEDIKPKDYVRIIGNVRMTPEPTISAHQMMKVKDHDEIPYHITECILFALKNQDPEAAANLKENPVAVKQEQENRSQLNTPTASPGLKNTLGETPVKEMKTEVKMEVDTKPAPPSEMFLKNKILKFLKENRKEDGHTAEEIGKATGLDANQLNIFINEVLDDGDISTTIDDNHFAILDDE